MSRDDARKARVVAIRSPNFPYAGATADCGNPRIVYDRAGAFPHRQGRFKMLPISRAFPEEAKCGTLHPIVHLKDRVRRRSRRPINSWVRDNGQEFVDAWPGNRPRRSTLSEAANARQRRAMPRRVLAQGVNKD